MEMAQEPVEDIAGYRDLVPIGRGGFSVVFRGHQEAFDRQVAIKVLMVGPEEALQRRFLREVKVTGKLSGHPHVVTALDAGLTWSGRPYLATALHERGSLHDRLMAQGRFPAAEVAVIGTKIAGALAAAHAVGIVHRDVKPSNILVSQYGEPALADFGVAYLFNDNGKTTFYDVFSPHHVAPEAINGVQPGPLGDIYALGSTLFQLVHGRTPFDSESNDAVAALLWKVMNDPTPVLDCPDLPELSGVLAKAMAKEPSERYADAGEFAQALRALVPDADVHPAGPEAAQTPAAQTPVAQTPAAQTPVAIAETPTARVVQAPGPATTGIPELTIVRPERVVEVAAAPAAKRRRWRIWAPALALVAIAATLTVVALGRGREAPAALATQPAPTPPSVAPEVLRKARPTGVTVKDKGALVTVRWTVSKDRDDQLFLQILAAGPATRPRTEAIPRGSGEFQVAGLETPTGYCFLVGAVVAWGSPSVVAWSLPTCIRGAVLPAPAASSVVSK
jgi:serine/threonine-protein kinase PknK